MVLKFRYLLLTFALIILIPSGVSASPLQKGSGVTLNEQLNVWSTNLNNTAPKISFLFSAIFTIMFLFGVVRLGYSTVTKTGQVMKGSTGLLIWVPITFFFIRILILLLFTTNSENVTLLASDFIQLISAASHSTVDWMISIGLVFYLFYHLIKHPEFGRWSKRMWVFAGGLTLLTFISPIVLGAV